MTPEITNTITSVVNSVIVVVVAFKVVRAINRLMSVLVDYPPHRHVNGRILFPKDFEPTRIETLGSSDANGRGT